MDRIKGRLLDDGRVKTQTDKVSPANHSNADQLFRLLATLGGSIEFEPRAKTSRTHEHTHDDEHHHH